MASSSFGHALFYSGVSGFSGSTGGSAPATPPYVGHFDRDIAGATGTVAVTGIGFKPAMVQIFWVDNGTARSGMYQTNQYHVTQGLTTNTGTTYTTAWYQTSIIDLYQGANRQSGYITSLDNDGFTISWTKVGSPTGTLACTYVCYPDLSVGISGTSGYSGVSGFSGAAGTKVAFGASQGGTASDVTGDGTRYNFICNTESFDTASAYNSSTGVFTAPVTGKYLFEMNVFCGNLESGHTQHKAYITTTSKEYAWQDNYTSNPLTYRNIAISVVADMTAGDTAYPAVQIYNGSKVVDLLGGETRFSGALVG